ncbi:MAG: hypothetical protein ACRDRP_14915 [Pseudonocardiaceae bacterium]
MQLAGGGGSFLAAAQQGMFAIDTVAASQMLTSIEQIQESLNKQLRQIHYGKRQGVMLGNLPEAQAIATIDALVVSGDQQSLDFALQRFAEVLDDLHQAVETCMRNYEQDDAQAAQGFRRISER